jgi:hypothetical protein
VLGTQPPGELGGVLGPRSGRAQHALLLLLLLPLFSQRRWCVSVAACVAV